MMAIAKKTETKNILDDDNLIAFLEENNIKHTLRKDGKIDILQDLELNTNLALRGKGLDFTAEKKLEKPQFDCINLTKLGIIYGEIISSCLEGDVTIIAEEMKGGFEENGLYGTRPIRNTGDLSIIAKKIGSTIDTHARSGNINIKGDIIDGSIHIYSCDNGQLTITAETVKKPIHIKDLEKLPILNIENASDIHLKEEIINKVRGRQCGNILFSQHASPKKTADYYNIASRKYHFHGKTVKNFEAAKDLLKKRKAEELKRAKQEIENRFEKNLKILDHLKKKSITHNKEAKL